MNNTKFVYFDVGGVSILDFSGTHKWEYLKSELGISSKNRQEFDAIWSKYQDRICIDCDVDSLIPELQQITDIQLPTDYSLLSDFVERFEVNATIWPIIYAAQTKYQIGLLTNMFPRMLEAIKKRQLLPDINWQAVVDSTIVGYQKPHPIIYQRAEELAQVQPNQIFFIDNSPENLQAAYNRGWSTLLYDPTNTEKSNSEIVKILEL